MNYKHTQIWYLTIYILISLAIYIIWLTFFTWELLILYFGLFLIFLTLIIFSTLKIEIDDTFLKIRFTNNILRKTFLLSEIKSVKKVKNHWYYGWGIRVWFWPYMWIFNISGFDAVEIIMNNWKVYRIWTDDVIKLEKAIKEKI